MEIADVRDMLRDAPLKMVAARIHRARKQKGYSLDQLAEAAETSRQHLINLEKGRHRPRAEMIFRLAEALGKPIDFFLVEDSGEPNPFPAEAA